MALASLSNKIYISSDSGVTWADIPVGDTNQSLRGVAISSNGLNIACVAYRQTIYVTPGGGTSTAYIADIYTSSNGGNLWENRTSAIGSDINLDINMTYSADGSRLIAIVSGGTTSPESYTITTLNNGSTWTKKSFPGPITGFSTNPAADKYKIISDNGGSKLIVAKTGFIPGIYISTNSGDSWTTLTPPGSPYINPLKAIAGSNDLNKLAIIVSPFIYTSTNSGATWTIRAGF